MQVKNKSIQGLRGLFAIGVLLSHCYFLGDYEQSAGIFSTALQKLANVSFFFMAAGFFLVKSSSAKLPMGAFLKKKMLRIYPLHLLVLAALVALSLLSGTFKMQVALPFNALLLQTWIPNLEIATSYNTVSWFLSSLLFCYIVGYWIIRLIHQRKNTYVITALLVLYKMVVSFIFPTDNTGYYWCYLCPVAGLADFMLGMTLGLLIQDRKKPGLVWLQVLAIFVLIGSFVLKNHLPTNYNRAFVMMPANILLLTAFSTETRFSCLVLGNRVMRFLGDVSFEVYLLHTLIIGNLERRSVFVDISQNISPFATLIILVTCCLTVAFVYKLLVDAVIKHWKKQNCCKVK